MRPGEEVLHPADLDPPTVPETWDGPDAPRCPDCGLYPDRYRATCLTCLAGGERPKLGDLPMGGCSTWRVHNAHLAAGDPLCENERGVRT